MSLETVRFLIVDRHKSMRALVKQVLRAAGARIFLDIEAHEGFLQAMTVFKPNCIVLDQDVPPSDGIALVKLLRALEDDQLRRVPVILTAALATQELVNRARNGGVDEFLCKPYSALQLARKVESAVHHTREFICVPNYVGPCRRRFVSPDFEGEKKRYADDMELEAQRIPKIRIS